ncbi:MAG: anion permease [Planctomycetes bacterium]|nr:anion permease [Planctomycetota bacterium]
MDWTPHALYVAALVVGSVALFVSGRIRYDVIAMGLVLALAFGGAISGEQALAGFGSGAVILLASMFVVARAITRTGLADAFAQGLGRLGGRSELRLLLVTGVFATLVSAVLNDTAVVAIFMPVVVTLARRSLVPASRLLMPLAYASLYGGMCSVIGTSTNVAINGAIRARLLDAERAGTAAALGDLHPFALFEFSVLGLLISGVGLAWMLLCGRHLLPVRPREENLTERYAVRRFLTEVLISPSSAFIGKPLAVAHLSERYGITCLGIVRREGDAVLAPTPYNYVRAGDTLILQGEPQQLVRFQEECRATVIPDVRVGEIELRSADVSVVEAIVPPTSPLVGSRLSDSPLGEAYRANVLALWRDGEAYGTGLRDVRLLPGDALLLQAHEKDLQRLRRDQMLVLVDGASEAPRLAAKAWLTLGILILGIGLAGANLVALPLATLLMALLVVSFRCIDPDEVYEAIDWRVILLTAGLLPLGVAFERHGLSGGIAEALRGLSGAGAHLALLTALFATSVALTQITTNVATGILLTPVAIDLALALGAPPNAYVLAVLFGASTSFMTPMAHAVNLMVMGPGDYRFVDYLRVGLPQALVTIAVAVTAIYLWYF